VEVFGLAATASLSRANKWSRGWRLAPEFSSMSPLWSQIMRPLDNKSVSLVAFLLLLAIAPSLETRAAISGETRQWTYTPPGESAPVVRFEAEYVGVKGVLVIVQDKTGKKAELPLGQLGAEDARYVEQMSRTRGGEFREWTDSLGNVLKVRYAGITGQAVILETEAGGSFEAPWDTLDEKQRAYVLRAQQLAADRKAAAVQGAQGWKPAVNGSEVATLNPDEPAEESDSRRLVFSPSGRLLFSAIRRKENFTSVRVWSTTELRPLCKSRCDDYFSRAISFTADEKEMWASEGGSRWRFGVFTGNLVYDEAGQSGWFGSRIKGLPFGATNAECPCFSPDGKILAVSLFGSRVPCVLVNPRTLRVMEQLPAVTTWHPSFLTFSSDGSTLLGTSNGYDAGTFCIWNLKKKTQKLLELHDNHRFVQLIDKGSLLALTYHKVRVFNTTTGMIHREMSYPEISGRSGLYAIAMSPEGRLIATDSRDRILLRNWETDTLLATLSSDGARVQQMAFSNDGKLLAAADSKGKIRIWKLTGLLANQASSNTSADEPGGEKPVTDGQPSPVPGEERFVSLFDGRSLAGWEGGGGYFLVEDGGLVSNFPDKAYGGHDANLYTTREYGDFILRFDYCREPNANSGILIRAPREGGDKEWLSGTEVQIVDNALCPKDRRDIYNGSLSGVTAARQGHESPPGKWNHMEIACVGRKIAVTLNGAEILAGNLDEFAANPCDREDHPGLRRHSGRIALNGSYSRGRVEYRNIRIRKMDDQGSDAGRNGDELPRQPQDDTSSAERARQHPDHKTIEGEWRVTAVRRNGAEAVVPGEDRYGFVKGVLTIRTADNPPSRLRYSLDPAQTPKHLDAVLEAGEERQVSPMVYELKGDTLRICYPAPGTPRPTELATTAGDQRTLIVMRRSRSRSE
jgi:uncharacterized protein (TIGR03067 family)